MNKLMLTSAICCIALLTGCGGGSGGESGGGSNDDGGNGGSSDDSGNGGGSDDGGNGGGSDDGGSGGDGSVNGVDPVVPLTATKLSTFEIANVDKMYTIQSGFDGDIEVVTDTSQTGGFAFSNNLIQLSNNVSSLNITDIQKTLIADISCDNGVSIKGTQDYDYSSGKVATSGTFNGDTYSCESLFQSPLATTVTNSSLAELLENWGDDEDDSNFISTTCPEDDDNEPEFEPFKNNCSGDWLTNYTITTTNPTKTHKVSTKINWK